VVGPSLALPFSFAFDAANSRTTPHCRDGETGRREGLKIPFPQGSPGSSPGPGIAEGARAGVHGSSLTDAVSFEVIPDHGLRTALAIDEHFSVAGFERVP
jgi:hypothetical protein